MTLTKCANKEEGESGRGMVEVGDGVGVFALPSAGLGGIEQKYARFSPEDWPSSCLSSLLECWSCPTNMSTKINSFKFHMISCGNNYQIEYLFNNLIWVISITIHKTHRDVPISLSLKLLMNTFVDQLLKLFMCILANMSVALMNKNITQNRYFNSNMFIAVCVFCFSTHWAQHLNWTFAGRYKIYAIFHISSIILVYNKYKCRVNGSLANITYGKRRMLLENDSLGCF